MFKFYDYALSDDQIASLYSGSYNVTPIHQWKLDDYGQSGGSNIVLDTGTATASNGYKSGAGLARTGTLDLDAILTIATSGTLSAPRGNLDLGLAGSGNVFYSHW